MSGLITYPKSYVYDQLGSKPRGNLYYLKYEADKVIAELENKLQNESQSLKETREYLIEWEKMCKNSVDNSVRVIRHYKYKRCLDKAKLCESEEKRLEAIAPLFDTDKECWEYASEYYVKWRKRWLELAGRFMEEAK